MAGSDPGVGRQGFCVCVCAWLCMGVCTCARVCSMLHVPYRGMHKGVSACVWRCVSVCRDVGCLCVCMHGACAERVYRYMGLNVCLCTVARWHVHTCVCTWVHMRGGRNCRWRVFQILALFTRASLLRAAAPSSLPWPCDRQWQPR